MKPEEEKQAIRKAIIESQAEQGKIEEPITTEEQQELNTRTLNILTSKVNNLISEITVLKAEVKRLKERLDER